MIKKFKEFEAISGTELVGHMGPNWGEEKNSPQIKSGMTDVIYSPELGRIIAFSEYQGLYGEYLKMGGKPLHGFNRDNLSVVIKKLNLSESFNEKYTNSVKSFCRKYRIKGELDDEGKLNVDGDVELSSSTFPIKQIPYKFGKVTGCFNCANNDIIDLTNSPDQVDGWFDCRVNKLKTLKGAPRESGSFYCNWNDLNDLVGSPEIVKSNFDCSNNKLTTLKGSPRSVGVQFTFSNNQIRDFIGIPEYSIPDNCEVIGNANPVWEIYQLFKDPRCIDLLNEFEVIRDGKIIIIDRLLEVYSTLGLQIPSEDSFQFKNYEIL